MATASHDSSSELVYVPLAAPEEPSPPAESETGIWLDGEVLACACPDCNAPMSIRLWLMLADCWRCGASLELTDEQEQAALRLLHQREQQRQRQTTEPTPAAAPAATTVAERPAEARQPPVPAGKPHAPAPAIPAVPVPSPAPSVPSAAVGPGRPRRVPAAHVPRGARARVRQIHEKGVLALLLDDILRFLPAWVVSLVVHIVAILLLGLWMIDRAKEAPAITLATSLSDEDLPGEGQEIVQPKLDRPEFEDFGGIELKNVLEETGAALETKVDLADSESTVEVPNPMGKMPDISSQSLVALPPAPVGHMFTGRDPKMRAHVVRREGGTSATEAAVARALRFLARHQRPDGSWNLGRFRTPDCDETCDGPGAAHSDVAATAMALLPFLGAGQTHQAGDYSEEIFRALNWLLEQQRDDGDLRGQGHGRMYAHGQASIALCEAYALTGDEQLRAPAQMALNFIIRAQHPKGGWRYSPGEEADTSVVGWQLMALRSGQMAYLHVPAKDLELTGLYLDRARADQAGALYGYRPRHTATPAMTAEGLLCRQYLGWPKEHPGLQGGVKYLLDHLPDPNAANIYYWYYATQVMHHMGGKAWETWNVRMRQTLLELQETEGHAAGSWAPRGLRGNAGGHVEAGGRLYMTSLAACILEVYYRHMPLYTKDALEPFEQ